MPRWPATQTFLPANEKLVGDMLTHSLFAFDGFQIGFDHFFDQLREGGLMVPTQFLAGLGGVAQQKLNITVMDVLNLPSLVASARAVVGFNSAILFECLLAPVPILVPRWGQAGEVSPDVQAPSPADPALHGHIRFVESREEMKQTLTKLITASTPPVLNMDERLDLFGRYFTYTRDRTCVERVEDFIDECVGAKR